MPTRDQYMDYVLSTRGSKRRRGHENDVAYNEWYYQQVVWGERYAWCLVKECHDMHHFGILELNGGKIAGCPQMPETARKCGAKVWSRPKRGSKAYTKGNRIGFDFNRTGEAEHTGTFWKERDNTSFWSVDGNTGQDQVLAKIRYYADVLFVVETLGLDGDTPTEEGNDVPDYVSLTTKKPVPVHVGEEVFVQFDREVSDQQKRSSDNKPTPGLFTAGKNGSVYIASVQVTGPATWELCEMKKDGEDWVQADRFSGGVDLMEAGNHLWLKLHPTGDGEVRIDLAKVAIWDR